MLQLRVFHLGIRCSGQPRAGNEHEETRGLENLPCPSIRLLYAHLGKWQSCCDCFTRFTSFNSWEPNKKNPILTELPAAP